MVHAISNGVKNKKRQIDRKTTEKQCNGGKKPLSNTQKIIEITKYFR